MVEIKHKRSKLSLNPRVASLRDTGYMYQAMQHAAQIKHDLEKIAVDNNKTLHEIGSTSVPSYLLWFLVDTYLDSYKMLLKENLIKSGNISKIQPTLN